MKNRKGYIFSVIIPVYNVERYLEETIESVVNQTIGFEENIQMILVNDGSPDNSDKICKKYEECYPENVIYVEQKNAGVSAARNTGIQYIKGKYVSFLDSDDKWSLDAFEKIYQFFEENKNKIDVVAGRMRFFEASEEYHALDYKFLDGTRVIDIREAYNCAHLHITSVVMTAEVVRKHSFDTRLRYGEDAKYLTEVILEKQTYGVMADTIHYYRKREANNSAIQTKNFNKAYYFDTPEYYYADLIRLSEKNFGSVLQYIQFIIMYDFQWRLKEPIPDGVLDEEEIKRYDESIRSFLNKIEDRIIIEDTFAMNRELKLFALCFKYGRDIRDEFECVENKIFFHGIEFVPLTRRSFLKITSCSVAENRLLLEGISNNYLPKEQCEIYFKVLDGKKYSVEFSEEKAFPVKCFKGIMYYRQGFRVAIPLKGKNIELKAMIRYGENFARLKICFRRLVGLNDEIEEAYCVDNGKIIFNKDKILHIVEYSEALHEELEEKYRAALEEDPELEPELKKQILKWRKQYWRKKKKQKKEIWLISDRNNRANDNGEHFFRYMQSISHSGIEVYYVIQKDCKDYKRMKKIGKVIPYGSAKHLRYFLLSSKIISSHINDYVINAFGENEKYVKDLYKFDVVFLQHGVTSGDISGWVNRYIKHIKVFVTAGKKEYASIINGNYGYDEKEVKLTGFPRYDHLMALSKNSTEKKEILFIPTWRQSIQGCVDKVTGESVYNQYFKDTDFYRFYNTLINDPRLLECMRRNGYKGKFCLHPSFTLQYVDFKENDCIKINQGYVDYQQEFVNNKLLVTDYSSVFFDFAYLKKPVVYTQFDKETFYSGVHVAQEGYYDFEEDGFGPVCYDYETAVEKIIECIENDCKIENKYLARINNFYAYFDQNNCERVYQAIREMGE